MTNRRQHTIPQFYLRPFLSPGFVYRKGANAPRRTRNPRDVAVHPDYYGRTAAERLTLDDLNAKIEQLGAPTFRKLVQNPRTFTQDDWDTISYVLANFAVRTPATIDGISHALLDMVDQANVLAEKMKEKLLEALEGGSDLSEFPEALPDDEAPSMTVEQMNEDASRMRAEGGASSSCIPHF